MVNDPYAAGGTARQPRCRVTVNGTPLPGVIDVEVTSASHFTADTYRVTASVSAGFDPAYWGESENDEIAISIGFEDPLQGLTLNPMLIGQVDDVDYDVIARTITLSGRDLSARFIDSKTSEKFQNLTSSEIVQQLAVRRGLDSDVYSTKDKAGRYYQIDHVTLSDERTEWDLLCYLAEREGFDVWVSGRTLHFQPPPEGTPYLILWSEQPNYASNCTSLSLTRSQTLAKDVIVKVKSWNQKQQTAFTVTVKTAKAKKREKGGEAQVYSYTVPNLSREQAQKYAERMAAQITKHERNLSASLPGDSLLSTRTQVQLVGTATDWDQLYFPETVTRRLSFNEGYVMDLRAKNHSPQDTISL